MEKKDKEMSQEDFLATVHGFAEEKSGDLLTDPAAVAASNETDRKEGLVSPGEKLRAMREKKGLSIEELSRATGIDSKLVEQVESGEAHLPLGLLIKAGAALSFRIRDVIDQGKEPFAVVRATERTASQRFGQAKRSSHGYEFESLAGEKGNRKMEPFVVSLTPSFTEESSSHEGQEFIYVLEGEVELSLGENKEVLATGDSAYYESEIPHRVRAKGTEPAKILAVLTD